VDSAAGVAAGRALPGMQEPSSEAWALPGFDVQQLIGYGGSGEVWRAVETATGDVVALKRLRPDAGPAAAEALRGEAAVLRTLDTAHVVRLRDVVDEGAGAVLVLDHADGGSLAALLGRRGTLDPGEVVTVAGPLAQALAAGHGRGLVHGDVTPANVLFTGAGMPLLSDLGLARVSGVAADRLDGTAEYLDPAVVAGDDPSPASDVWGLAAVCHHMLAGSPPHEGASVADVLSAAASGRRAPLGLLAPQAPRPLVEAVEAALSRDPAQRPDAAAFAAALRRAHAAAPVRLRGPGAAAPAPGVRATHAVPRHAAPPRAIAAGRRRPGWAVPALAGVVLLGAAGGTGWWMGRTADPAPAGLLPAAETTPPPPSGGPPPSGSTGASDWAEVLDGLDAARADAFATADVTRLADVYVAGSPGHDADAALVHELAASGKTASGVRHAVREVEPQARTPTSARLLVVDTLSAYQVRAGDGVVERRVPARGEAAYLVDLARTDDGWRLVRVTPV
jgi:eukaryotic-like serine/threonine-protein kinase